MKKYAKNRNEALFNKLFESQGITVKTPGVKEDRSGDGEGHKVGFKGLDTDNESEDADEKWEQITLVTYNILDAVTELINLGADERQIHKLIKRIDAKALYKSDATGVPYETLFETTGKVEELGVPQMTAWQTVEEETFEESKGVDATDLEKVSKALRPASAVLRTIDDPYEAESIIRHILKSVRSLVGDKLSDTEILLAIKSILKSLQGGESEEVSADTTEPEASATTQQEVHILADPEEK